MQRLLLLSRLVLALVAASAATVTATEFHVANQGRDTNRGTRSSPFATLERARAAVRAARQGGVPLHGITVWIHGGEYPLTTTFELGEADSGAPDRPVVYRAVAGESVRLTGARTLPGSGFQSVTDPNLLSRIDSGARDQVRVLELRSLGITNCGGFPDQFSGAALVPELFCNDRRMTLARWPNEGWTEFTNVVESGPASWRNHASDQLGKFVYTGDRPRRWTSAPSVWLQGYWCFDWSSETIRVLTIDTNQHQITLAKQHHYGLGSGNSGGRRYCAVNLLEELDQPGEYFLDPATRRLFFWPPAPLATAQLRLSLLTSPVIALRNASEIMLRDLTVELCAGNGIEVTGGSHDRILACRIRNTGLDGVVVEDGTRHVVAGCDISENGTAGLKMRGGDRRTLTPSGHEAVNNHIWNVSRRQRTHAFHAHLAGVGIRFAHNLLHDGPHQAIGVGGNDHVIEYNEIHHVGMETDDCGAFYMGRNPSERGTVLRYNYWHDVGSTRAHGSCAIYFDDGAGGQTVFGNIFYRAAGGNFGAVFSHGGHDNWVRNCLFIDCPRALGSAPWPNKAWQEWLQGDLWQQALLKDVDISRSPYRERYPELKDFMNSSGAPRHNHASENVVVRCRSVQNGNWAVTNNFITDTDPGFRDAAKGDFRLREDSPIFSQLPNFVAIPSELIGLQNNEFRPVPIQDKLRRRK